MSVFQFKHFSITQANNAMKVGTDAMILGALIDSRGASRALDIGAGTGVLSLMVAQQNLKILIDAVEIDELAAKECALNFKNSTWSDRLIAHASSFLDFEADESYDLIVTNPPYYQTNLGSDDNRLTTAKHVGALSPIQLLTKSASLMKAQAELWIILPYSDREQWMYEAEMAELFPKSEMVIYGKRGDHPKRSVICFTQLQTTTRSAEFIIREMDGSYTEEYKLLTQDFHGVALR